MDPTPSNLPHDARGGKGGGPNGGGGEIRWWAGGGAALVVLGATRGQRLGDRLFTIRVPQKLLKAAFEREDKLLRRNS